MNTSHNSSPHTKSNKIYRYASIAYACIHINKLKNDTKISINYQFTMKTD